jgi:hypothetical protein
MNATGKNAGRKMTEEKEKKGDEANRMVISLYNTQRGIRIEGRVSTEDADGGSGYGVE